MQQLSTLLHKYNKLVPRYTSYPTVPHWYNFDDTLNWQALVKQQYTANKTTGISLYIHLPFCESLCTYCGCNKKITTNHNVEHEYIQALLTEWQLYVYLLGETPVIRELHLGGGTPTFFSPANLEKLLTGIFSSATLHNSKEFSFEGHPNNTSFEHLATLSGLGFTRVSYGVQDNDPVVQKAINRPQPFYNVVKATENARTAGYTSVNFDLVYGLPFQTTRGMAETFDKIIGLKPERIAFYSYAHVPWKQKAQRLFDETNLPSPEQKIALNTLGKNMLVNAGYVDIGMDHFALPADELYSAWKSKQLHRNFMGYTTAKTNYLLGLGVSAISDIGNAYAQNAKELENYYRAIKQGALAIKKGYVLNDNDSILKNHIQNIACNGETILDAAHTSLVDQVTNGELETLERDGLIRMNGPLLQVTTTGRQFLRNVCNVFDACRKIDAQNRNIFSKAI